MKLIYKMSFPLVLSASLITGHVWAEQYQFKFNIEPSSDIEVSPKVMPNEHITINGQPVVAFDTSFFDPLGDEKDKINFKVNTVRTKIGAEILSRLALYGMPNGSVFVPKDWRLVKGQVGANGSQSYTFSAPNGEGFMTFYDASACVGCAQSAASAFFSEAYKEAKENDFTAYDSTNLPMKNIRLNPHLVAYSVEQKGQRLDGVAYYNVNSDSAFWQAEISLPTTERDLANPLLNQFIFLAKDR